MDEQTVREKIEKLMQARIDFQVLLDEYKRVVEDVIPVEVRDKISSIKDHYAPITEYQNGIIKVLEAEIRADVMKMGQTVKDDRVQIIYTKGRTSWATKELEGYAVSHPEINVFKHIGEPSVIIRYLETQMREEKKNGKDI